MKKILIAHPGKHHALHLVAGCLRAAVDVTYLTPLYCPKLLRTASKLMPFFGSQISGYGYGGADSAKRIFSPTLSTQKVIGLLLKNTKYEAYFDRAIAELIYSGSLEADIFVSLQDYMFESTNAAKRAGMTIWSDQIINQSQDALSRISKSLSVESRGASVRANHRNTHIIQAADLITAPSTYCLSGLQADIPSTCRVTLVPYGGDLPNARASRVSARNSDIKVCVRANSVRKGGHIFAAALQSAAKDLERICRGRNISFSILGILDSTTRSCLNQLSLPPTIKVNSRSVPHSEMGGYLESFDLFVMPSLTESMSMLCVEAMCAGIPSIITPYCGIDGFLDGHMGLIIEPNVISCTRGMVHAFEQQQHWERWGDAARNLGRTFTWQRYEDTIATIARTLESYE